MQVEEKTSEERAAPLRLEAAPEARRGEAPPRALPPGPGGRGAFTLDGVVRFFVWTGLMAAAGFGLWYFSGLVLYLVAGGVLAYLLKPVVDRLRGMGLGHVPAILATFVLVFGALIFVIVSLAPSVVEQVTELSRQVSLEALSDTVRALERRLVEALPFYQEGALVASLREVSETLFRDEGLTSTMGSVMGLFTGILYATIAIPFVSFFLLKDGTQLRHRALALVPNRYFEITLAIIAKVEASLGRYLRALVIQCSAVAVVAFVLLYLAGLNYALAVGIFAGLANSIPYFGPFVGFVAGSLVGIAQTGDFSMVPSILVAMALTQLADNILFQPLIFSKAAQAHPLVILFVVLIGAQLGGLVGMLVAIPVATTLRVVAGQVWWSLRNYRILRART